jgi:hypothetical protein
VREEVVIWVDELHEHEECSALIHDLLDLIMQEVLCTDPSKRTPAKWLSHQLNCCLNKAEGDKSYLLQPVPRRPKLSSDWRANSTPKELETQQTGGKKVAFTQPERPVPLTEAHQKLPKDLVLRSLATPGRLSRSKTHGTWPQWGQGND